MGDPLHVYIDETGDRGTRSTSSPYFTFSAVCVRRSNNALVRDFMDSIKPALGLPAAAKPKWKRMTHLQRVAATLAIADLPVRLIFVCVPKASMRQTSKLVADPTAFYNYAARMLVERVSWLARTHHTTAHLTFEKVKGFPPSQLRSYLDLLRQRREPSTDWDHIHRDVRVDSPANIPALLVPDLTAGAWDAATRPDRETGLTEPAYLHNMAKLVYRSQQGKVLGYGVKVLGPTPDLCATPLWKLLTST